MAVNLLPPLPTWPPRVFTDEPAHAVFRRIAQVNGQLSATTFAATVGLNGRNVRPGDFIEFCEQFPMAGIERLRRSTPEVDGNWVHFRGQTFRMSSDVSFRHPRICTGCVAEERYYRNWFDIWPIGRCPFHDCPLIRGTNGYLAWWHPPLTTTPAGEELEVKARKRLDHPPESWERYALGRMGLAEPFGVPILDAAQLWQIGQAAEIIGWGAQNGWTAQVVKRPAKYSPERAAAIGVGFNILSAGSRGIDNLLNDLARGRPDLDRFPNTGVHRVFGSFKEAVRQIACESLNDLLQNRIQAVARELGVISRKNRATVSLGDADQITLKEAAKMLGVSPKKLRKVGTRAEVIAPVPNKNCRYWISSAQFEELKTILADLITRSESMRLLDMTAEQFDTFCKQASLVPLTRLPGGDGRRDQFRRSIIIDKAKIAASMQSALATGGTPHFP